MKDMLRKLDYKVVLLVMLSLASPFVSGSVALPVAIICFAGLVSFNRWLEFKTKPVPSEELAKEVSAIRNQMSNIMMRNAAKPEEMSRELKRFF